jgi:hypothetical protein
MRCEDRSILFNPWSSQTPVASNLAKGRTLFWKANFKPRLCIYRILNLCV